MLLAEYFIFIVFKDLFIWVSQLLFGGFLGFWHGLILHIVTTPLDILILLILSVWGTAVLHQEGSVSCWNDSECLPFYTQARYNIIIGYGYVFTCLFVKPLILAIFCFACGGLRWMQEDEQEEKNWQIKRVQGRVVSSMRSGTFESIYGTMRN